MTYELRVLNEQQVREELADLLFSVIGPGVSYAQAVEIIRRTLSYNGETLIISTVPPLDSDQP